MLTKSLTFIFIAVIGSTASFANSKNSPEQLTFLAAEKAFAKGDLKTYLQLKKALKDYPLYPYLEYKELLNKLSRKHQKDIDSFITEYSNTPLANRLKYRFAQELGKQNHIAMMQQYYSYGSDPELDCKILKHQLKNGSSIKSLSNRIEDLWSVPKSQDKACDSLFTRWIDKGLLTEEVAYHRFYRTAQEGSIGLLKYLKRFLPRNQQYIADLWIRVKKDPGVVNRTNFFPGKDPNLEAPLLVYAIKKLAWGDRDRAYRVWQHTKNRIPLAEGHHDDIERTLFLALATENNSKALDWLDKKNISRFISDDLVSHWKLAVYLRNERWNNIKQLFQILPNDQRNSNKWKYWNAIAQEKTGQHEESAFMLKELAQKRDYYGYLAASRLNQPLKLNHEPVTIDTDVIKQVKSSDYLMRAKELFELERYINATREWRYLLNNLNSDSEIMAASKIAHSWGWYNQGILTIAKTGHWDDTDIRFPTAFKSSYIKMAKKVNLPPQWLMGVSRQESAYGPLAVSPAGAYGLMQVMPATAKVYSNKFNIPYSSRRDLLKPDINIEMGSRYLELRYDQFSKNPVYASAAYNAGKNRIDMWKKFGRHPTDIWIESIPYTETRIYIKKVMTYRAVYALKLGIEDDIFNYILTSEMGGDTSCDLASNTNNNSMATC
ncbi:transglycosylase SLT domain-containing protein [Kangiella sediminilitoris]|uniref:Lytic transglycosylase catalytic n=1 Tax=Kangiella sediminilitoris TaxID=1144748 RepID=A0A1B3BAB8_9GAMM|nr:transglycosylase SLT domain-containing protein [Kangiella sediminilitoris]AOE49686.1 Lytic transglycosylase catalytic [Kangiella sediminilitoris]